MVQTCSQGVFWGWEALFDFPLFTPFSAVSSGFLQLIGLVWFGVGGDGFQPSFEL